MTCESCFYWQHRTLDSRGNTGNCRRYPPTIENNDSFDMPCYPITGSVDSCGEYRGRPGRSPSRDDADHCRDDVSLYFGKMAKHVRNRQTFLPVIVDLIMEAGSISQEDKSDMLDWFNDCYTRAAAYYQLDDRGKVDVGK